ncbi:hypothetical protein KRZ98_08555 [Sphingobium sp. AS12]|nr:hypothetical protein [Sphingobium sp. AS12]MBV2148335.1 hypothetical protein [Sphingobium sp. AS12]
MDTEPIGYEESARIVEAFAESEEEPRVLELLAELATAIRARALND